MKTKMAFNCCVVFFQESQIHYSTDPDTGWLTSNVKGLDRNKTTLPAKTTSFCQPRSLFSKYVWDHFNLLQEEFGFHSHVTPLWYILALVMPLIYAIMLKKGNDGRFGDNFDLGIRYWLLIISICMISGNWCLEYFQQKRFTNDTFVKWMWKTKTSL